MYEILELQTLYGSIANIKLPLKTTYKFTRLMKRAETELEFYQAKFQEIVAEFGEKDDNGQYKLTEDGQSIVIIAGKEQECNAKLFELRNLDVEINDIKFTIEELEGIDISISELACIMSLIED
jgi:predicted transcriptional regulator